MEYLRGRIASSPSGWAQLYGHWPVIARVSPLLIAADCDAPEPRQPALREVAVVEMKRGACLPPLEGGPARGPRTSMPSRAGAAPAGCETAAQRRRRFPGASWTRTTPLMHPPRGGRAHSWSTATSGRSVWRRPSLASYGPRQQFHVTRRTLGLRAPGRRIRRPTTLVQGRSAAPTKIGPAPVARALATTADMIPTPPAHQPRLPPTVAPIQRAASA